MNCIKKRRKVTTGDWIHVIIRFKLYLRLRESYKLTGIMMVMIRNGVKCGIILKKNFKNDERQEVET